MLKKDIEFNPGLSDWTNFTATIKYMSARDNKVKVLQTWRGAHSFWMVDYKLPKIAQQGLQIAQRELKSHDDQTFVTSVDATLSLSQRQWQE